MSNLTPYEVSNQSNPYPLIADSKWLQTKLGWIWLDHYVDVRHLRQLDSSTFRPPNLWRFWSGPEIVKLHEIPRVFFGRKESNFGEKKEISKKEKTFTLWLYAYLQGFPHCDLRSGLLHWTSTLQRAAGCGMRNASGRKSMRCRVPNRNACAISLEAMHVCFHGFYVMPLTECFMNFMMSDLMLHDVFMVQLVHSQSKSMPSMQPKEKYQVPDVTTFNLPGSGGGSGKSPGELRTSKLLRFALHWNHWWKTKIVPLRHLSRPFPTFRSRKDRRVLPGLVFDGLCIPIGTPTDLVLQAARQDRLKSQSNQFKNEKNWNFTSTCFNIDACNDCWVQKHWKEIPKTLNQTISTPPRHHQNTWISLDSSLPDQDL